MAEVDRSYVVHDDRYIKGFVGEYRWLSNMHECWILWHGLAFSSVEAAYQASKSHNIEVAKKFQDYSGPESKKQSKLISVRKDWPELKLNVMSQLVFQKFLQHADLRGKLLATGDRYIEETNYWKDQYWGVCNGAGQNNLGKILMCTREYFKKMNEL